MMNAHVPNAKMRLNPFLFPSETDLRFVLLIVVLLAESLFTYSYLQSTLFIEPQTARTLECNEISGHFGSIQQFDPQMFSLFNSEAGGEWAAKTNESSRIFEECMREWDLSNAFWGIGGCVLFALVTFCIYWFTPARKIKREKYEPLPVEDAGEVLDALKSICAEIGIPKLPTFLWSPLNPVSSGLAFGRFGKYFVAITGGLVTQYYTDREAFRSVILHELAHLRNKDVDKTYLTVAAWQAFIFVVLLPQFFMVFISPLRELLGGLENINRFFNSLGYALVFAVDAMVLFILVYLSRNALLRTRELYADARASVWDGPNGSLGRVLQTMSGNTAHKTSELFRTHPDSQKRFNLLTNTTLLFTIGLLDVFMIGTAAMVGTDEFRRLFLLLLPYFSKQEIVAGLVTGLLYAVILVGILGTLVWRSVFFSTMTNQRQSRWMWWKIGMMLGMGSALGASISFANAVNVLYGVFNIVLVLILNIFLGFLLGIAFSLFLSWLAENADVWLAVASTPAQVQKIYITLSLFSIITMACWLGWAFSAWSPGNAALTLFDLAAGLPLAAANPFTILFFALLWLCPLSVYFWSKEAALIDRTWGFLDAPAQPVKIVAQQFSLKKAALIGCVIGVLYFVSDFIITILLRFIVPQSTRASDDYKIISFVLYIVIAALAQVLIAIIVAMSVKELKFQHGLMAAFVGGCIMAVGFSVNNLVFGGGLMFIVFPWMLNSGALLALSILLLISATTSQRKH
jgi:Zn-dependent protease with chaperone function